ncbi:reverse transcriptase domain-containing protein [Tanacetum coccineum]
MHTRASNSELVKPLPEPERTLNRRLRRRNRRVPFNQRNNPPQNPRVVYPPILDINHFRHFLVILENLYPMDDEPMWAADHVVAPTLGSAITIPETVNEFAIKGVGIGCQVSLIIDKDAEFCFVYAKNTKMERNALLKDLECSKRIVANQPWVLIGDFNATLNVQEHFVGGSLMTNDMHDFKDCVNSIEVKDI